MGTGTYLVPRRGTYVKHGSKEYLLAATHPAGDSPLGEGTASNLSWLRKHEQGLRSHGGDRFGDGGDGLLGVPDGVVHVGHRTGAAHVDVAVQQ